jgi:hypothetical protein
MTERIDHAAEAVSDIRYADEVLADGGDSEVAKAVAAVAQVHATLALVEQQRIANLMAVLANAARMVAEKTGSADQFRGLFDRLDPIIREGLGL